MEELQELLSQRLGLSKKDSEKAVETMLSFLKEKLPDPIGSQLESFLGGGFLGQAGELLQGLGLDSLLGGGEEEKPKPKPATAPKPKPATAPKPKPKPKPKPATAPKPKPKPKPAATPKKPAAKKTERKK